MKLKFVKLDPRAVLPKYAHASDSGMDVYALEDKFISARFNGKIRTGVAAVIPTGYELQVRPRSGLTFKKGIVGAFGTVDGGYRGEICIALYNHTDEPFVVKAGDRVAQLVLAPVAHAEVVEASADELGETDRGAAGFGSTGR